MPSPTDEVEYDNQNTLPPILTSNLREKLYPEQVILSDIKTHEDKANFGELQETTTVENPIELVPKYPLHITWTPDVVCVKIRDEVIEIKIRVWNSSARSLYIKCGGLWNETARLGASWRCYPRTRFLLAPGLACMLSIKATPRHFTPIPFAQAALQLVACHKRDNVVGYFAVPIMVKFEKYIPPCRGEDG